MHRETQTCDCVAFGCRDPLSGPQVLRPCSPPAAGPRAPRALFFCCAAPPAGCSTQHCRHTAGRPQTHGAPPLASGAVTHAIAPVVQRPSCCHTCWLWADDATRPRHLRLAGRMPAPSCGCMRIVCRLPVCVHAHLAHRTARICRCPYVRYVWGRHTVTTTPPHCFGHVRGRWVQALWMLWVLHNPQQQRVIGCTTSFILFFP